MVDDTDLIAGARAGDRLAARRLYDRHAPRVYRLIFRMVSEDSLAQEYTQDTFVKAFDRLEQYRGESAFSTWLHSVAVSSVLTGFRRRKRLRFRETELEEASHVATRSDGSDLGREYATGHDVELLRSGYAGLSSATAKQAILSVLAEEGGASNLRWLLGVAGDAAASPELRAQAIEAGQRAGASAAQLGTLYAQAPDRRAKEAAINGLLKRGDRPSVDLLLGIARTETDPTVRRSLISRLGRLEDARVKEFLKELVGQ